MKYLFSILILGACDCGNNWQTNMDKADKRHQQELKDCKDLCGSAGVKSYLSGMCSCQESK